MEGNPKLQLTLNRDGVAAPIGLAALVSIDVIAASLTAFADVDLKKPIMPNQFLRFQIRGPEMTSDQRREMYQNWLLAKGFQDLARGVRQSLEEAAVYINLLSSGPLKIRSSATLEEIIEPIRDPIEKLNFPDLMSRVNAGLTARLDFEVEFRSMQRVRNCLEHREGVVRRRDLDAGTSTLTLSFPRLKVFYMRGEEEVELARDERVDAQDGQPDVQILARIVPRSKTYALGDRVTFTTDEFTEIARACSFFGRELAEKLPSAPNTSAAGQHPS